MFRLSATVNGLFGINPHLFFALLLIVTTSLGCDSGGGSAPSAINADQVAPEIRLSSPDNLKPFFTNQSPLRLSGTAADNESVDRIIWSNSTGTSGRAVGTEAWEASIPLSTGTNNITVTALDVAGNEASVALTVTYDITLPSVQIEQPTQADSFATDDDMLAISGSALDDSGIASVSWSVDTGQTGAAAGTANWEASIPLTGASNAITVTAADLAGNVGTDTIMVTKTQGTFTLSGTVVAASNTAIDGDVNDPNAPYAANDNFTQAQILPTPATLGGYVNRPGTGPDGRSFAGGDINDVFEAELLAGESIVLNIAQTFFTDLDLYLYDAGSLELIDAALGVTDTESLTVPQNGRYMIQVFAVRGASTYTLTIGRTDSRVPLSHLVLSRRFMPDEAIVLFSQEKQSIAERADAAGNPALMGLAPRAGAPEREMLYIMDRQTSGNSLLAAPPHGLAENPLSDRRLMDAGTRRKLDTLYTIKALRDRADIDLAEPNYLYANFRTPADEYYPLQWHYSLINLPDAWEATTGSPDVVVAVIDSGVLREHPDLSGKLTEDGFDFIRDPDRALDGDGIDEDPQDPGDRSQGGGSFHGTHVAGTVAAATNNANGVAGAGWQTRIMAVRALGKNGVGTSYDILQGVRYAAGLENDSGSIPSRPADIINLSLGGSAGFSQAEQNVYNRARNAGVIIVAAAGNSAVATPGYPASYEGVISVSAVDINANLAPYSNFGPFIDVAAPGGDFSTDLNSDGYVDGIMSTGGDDSDGSIQFVYSFLQGTSMAAPHVAGVAALMKALRPGLDPPTMDDFIQSGAIVRDIGEAGRDDLYGFGLIDASRAVAAARNGAVPTMLNVSPSALTLGSILNTAELTAIKVGSEPLNVLSVSDNVDWLSITPTDTDGNGIGTYVVTIDRAGLAAGEYSAKITFTTTVNTVEVPVSMRIAGTGIAPDAGYQYVLLVDSVSSETVAQVSTAGEGGLYEYRFSGVRPGSYLIYAGTDSDNDFIVGDAGEASGAYISTDQPTVLSVDADLADLDFATEFAVNIPDVAGAALHPPAKRQTGLKRITR